MGKAGDAALAARRRASPPAPPALPPGAQASIVGRSPFGLSIEYPLMERALGAGPCPGPALVAMLRELGSPTLRVGGDSQDLAGPSGAYHYPVPASFWPALGCLARETGSQITVGLNFATAPLADELADVAAAEQAIPAGQLSFSLGNEPDLYGISHILPNEPAFTVPVFRAAPWTAAQYLSEWDSRRALLGPVAIEGPDFAGSQWGSTAASQLAADPPTTFDVHDYPTSACGAGAERPTPARLLGEHASVGLLDKYAWMLALAHSTNRPIVVSESNSASCGGTPGISNTPVAEVWAARFVVASLLAGYAQVRFHSAGTSYDPLLFGANGAVTLTPLGRALLFVHRWIPLGSRIEPGARASAVLAARITAAGGSTSGGPGASPSGESARSVNGGAATGMGAASMILSSFSTKAIAYEVDVQGTARSVHTDTLTTNSPAEVGRWVAVHAHRARVLLAPNTVVAVALG